MPTYFIPDVSGLGNRLSGIAGILRRQERLKDELSFYWTEGGICDLKYEGTFRNELPRAEQCNSGVMFDWRLWAEDFEVPGGVVSPWPNARINFLYERMPKPLLNDYIRLFKRLEPGEEIQERASGIVDKFPNAPILGVRLRDAACYTNKWQDAPLENYFKVVDSFPNHLIYLSAFTDDKHNAFVERYKDRMLDQKKPEYKDGKDGFAQMMAMSKLPVLVGHYATAFVECAWFFGECKAKVFRVYKT